MLQKLKNLFSKEELKNLIRFIYLSLAINLFIEILNRSSLLGALKHVVTNPLVFLYNTLIVLLTFSVAFLVKRRFFVSTIVSIIWLGFAITNAVLLSFRVTPFTAVDLSLMDEAIPMIHVYLTKWQIVLIVIAAIVVITLIVLLFIFAPKYKQRVARIRNAVCIVLLFGSILLLTSLGISTNALAKNFGNLADAYKDYGFVYCFTNSLVNTGIDKPKSYSEEKMVELAEDTLTTPPEIKEDKKKTPNIIMIQLESLYDVTLMKDYTYSEDPLPNYHALQKEFSHGFLNVPSVGAGTANTEFEVLTGMDLDFFGPGEYPYKTILKEKTSESMAYNLKELNYSTHAIHNNDGTFYGRNQVFSNLGFDTFTSLEYMHNVELNPMGWAKDHVLIEEILKALKSTKEQDFVYTISVQGHGKYPGSEDDFSVPDSATLSSSNPSEEEQRQYTLTEGYTPAVDAITVDGIAEADRCAFEYYVNQIHEMDAFIGDLINEFKKLDEDVVLVFYGDHLPSLGIEASDLENDNIYQTSYVIWDNMNLPKIDMDMEAYQITASILKRLNIDNGYLTKLHQNSLNTANYLEELELLQYDMLYGDQTIYGGTSPYIATNLQMGVDKIKVNGILTSGDNIYIQGENFTEYSKVFLNDTELETTYVDEKNLSISTTTLNTGDEIKVGQKGDDKVILSYSEPYVVK
ncbi:Phosphoglycerol transferase MdoB [Anaerosporobacter mobilis DSM 15930]|jgi:phosphoglycerol transferase MdoB-like AlkP superfamily enzyme|uniref:Phosphoglycerol transferase MdoB n=1 Tax=Anaerosporobacter mobilis DSM 15930 TaxID=1120996 RepID=A0A1M7L0Y8_9FIRM|nr:sulfatase-like hydrolase/transferase [Anaerosporobacter mobilis]SHM71471.1 Phosphoglycerol transferase MdoB [Anaerosporobacter mobilis DSM 15930]